MAQHLQVQELESTSTFEKGQNWVMRTTKTQAAKTGLHSTFIITSGTTNSQLLAIKRSTQKS